GARRGRGVQLPAGRAGDCRRRAARGTARGRRPRRDRHGAVRRRVPRRVRERHLGDPLPGRPAAARPVLRVRAILLGGGRADTRTRVVASLTLDNVPAKQLAQRWGVPQAGVFRRLGSTFDAIHDLGAQGAPHGTVVLAEEQTAGRGRDGRTWHSPAGGVWL